MPVRAADDRTADIGADTQGAGRTGRTTEDLKSVFGEDLELADWLGGIREQGDYEWCGFDASGYDPLMIEKRLEQQVKRQMAEMEEHYETDDRI